MRSELLILVSYCALQRLGCSHLGGPQSFELTIKYIICRSEGNSVNRRAIRHVESFQGVFHIFEQTS